MAIFFTSDLHLMHDREFLYKPRGFDNVWDMNRAIVERWNAVVAPDDDVYCLGDIMLNNNDEGIRLLKQLKGRIHIICGNHDSPARIELYEQCYNVVEVVYATVLKYGKYRFYLSHYPTITTNLDETHFSQHLLNLYGHTHQGSNFFNDNPFMYHVGLDSHGCTPVDIDTVIEDMRAKYKECGDML